MKTSGFFLLESLVAFFILILALSSISASIRHIKQSFDTHKDTEKTLNSTINDVLLLESTPKGDEIRIRSYPITEKLSLDYAY